jgi:hypothetical protein
LRRGGDSAVSFVGGWSARPHERTSPVKLLLLVVVLPALTPIALRHRIMRRVLLVGVRVVLVLGCVHLLIVAGILMYSMLGQTKTRQPLHGSVVVARSQR